MSARENFECLHVRLRRTQWSRTRGEHSSWLTERDWRDELIWFIWFVSFIWLV